MEKSASSDLELSKRHRRCNRKSCAKNPISDMRREEEQDALDTESPC